MLTYKLIITTIIIVIDLHTHTFFSDGVLNPSELVYRAKCNGYGAIAITDHVDFSNMYFIIPNVVRAAKILTQSYDILVLPGVELTYVPPELIASTASKCRKLGAMVILVHGETVAEHVPLGTNMHAVTSDIDILAHPGYLSEEEAYVAYRNDIKIEITTKIGHGITNEHVAKVAINKKAKLILNTDTHKPKDLLTKDLMVQTLLSAKLYVDYYKIMQKNSYEIISKIGFNSSVYSKKNI
ncbi:MAG: histidinol phosphate phosphatase domain-containing protein [Endomicrobium sp.]|jgi:histidinol phosphatase-like PHP family hydrolase|nr:histidinol phosphate phosphatase domain-containing protein [Endomicrobium sp.]